MEKSDNHFRPIGQRTLRNKKTFKTAEYKQLKALIICYYDNCSYLIQKRAES